ncbi:MAG: hypothetical protein WCR21_10070 [Bacteroidota bacterium]
MSAHHEENHHQENKPVSFTVPFIMASALLLIIMLFLSLCDPKKAHHGDCECKEGCSKECMEACEKGDHSMHPKDMKSEEAAVEEKAAESNVVASDSAQSQAPAEVKAEEAHH